MEKNFKTRFESIKERALKYNKLVQHYGYLVLQDNNLNNECLDNKEILEFGLMLRFRGEDRVLDFILDNFINQEKDEIIKSLKIFEKNLASIIYASAGCGVSEFLLELYIDSYFGINDELYKKILNEEYYNSHDEYKNIRKNNKWVKYIPINEEEFNYDDYEYIR